MTSNERLSSKNRVKASIFSVPVDHCKPYRLRMASQLSVWPMNLARLDNAFIMCMRLFGGSCSNRSSGIPLDVKIEAYTVWHILFYLLLFLQSFFAARSYGIAASLSIGIPTGVD
jgi:hypothetical protein